MRSWKHVLPTARVLTVLAILYLMVETMRARQACGYHVKVRATT
jgi:hypothetical protein